MDSSVIIGYGVIGRAVAEAFGVKKYYSRSDANITLEEAAKLRYIFICLPTPTINGQCYTQDIYETVKTLIANKGEEDSVIIIRSTVPPGFNKSLQDEFGVNNIISNPEFISNDTAVEDMKNPDLIVVGGEKQKYIEMVVALYKGRFKYIEPVVTDTVTAEFIKYALNMFFVTKLVYANQLNDAAIELGANYQVARKVLETHKWGSKNHFQTFHKNGRGAGGKCLKKDLEAFGNLAIKQDLFYYLEEINNKYLEASKKI